VFKTVFIFSFLLLIFILWPSEEEETKLLPSNRLVAVSSDNYTTQVTDNELIITDEIFTPSKTSVELKVQPETDFVGTQDSILDDVVSNENFENNNGYISPKMRQPGNLGGPPSAEMVFSSQGKDL
jgi:hypothetical protein